RSPRHTAAPRPPSRNRAWLLCSFSWPASSRVSYWDSNGGTAIRFLAAIGVSCAPHRRAIDRRFRGRKHSPMLVEQLLTKACERLAVVDAAASIRDAAQMMGEPHTDLVIVCKDGVAVGVVTRTDIVMQISRRSGADLDGPVETVMTCDIATCRAGDPLTDVWQMMKSRGFHRIPVVDETCAPLGIVYARDALQCLLQ